jgi:hypothetical protein
MYSSQDISCETPPEENAEIEKLICENNMVGYDLVSSSEILYF